MPIHRWPLVALLLAILLGLPLLEAPIVAGARGVGFAVCHQIPDRSFFVDGEQLPLCARCTGIYLGFLVGLVGMALLGKLGAALWPPRALAITLMLLMLAMVGDGFNSLVGSLPEPFQAYRPTNLLRLTTGISAGTSLALLLIPLVNDALWARRDMSESVSDLGELAGIAVIAALVATLVYSEHPVTLIPVSLLGTAGVLATLGAAGTALAATLLRRERRARSFREAVPLLVVGLGLAVASVAALAALRHFLGVSTGI